MTHTEERQELYRDGYDAGFEDGREEGQSEGRDAGLRAALDAVKYEHDLEHTNTGHCVDAVRRLLEQTRGEHNE